VIFEKMVLLRVTQLRGRQMHVGAKKLQKMLADPAYGLPVRIGRDHLFRLLRENKMLSKLRKPYHRTSDSKHLFPIYPNLLKDLKISAANQAWVCDITYLRLPKGRFCYLFLVTDLFSRKIIGHALRDSLASEGAEEALLKAFQYAKPAAGFIHHSDHGIQYCCKSYTELLQKFGARISMTGENHCYDNAVAERINGILKQEFGLGADMASFAMAQRLTNDGINIYNAERLHFSLGCKTPDCMYALSHRAVGAPAEIRC